MALPKLSNLLGTIQTTADRISSTVPVIRTAVDTVTTIASGKRPEPSPIQGPAAEQALVPRNVGQLDASVAKAGITGSMIVFGLAVLVVFYIAKRR